MTQFPDLQTLSAASEDEILSAWAGLGYYSRARNIKKTADLLQKFILENHRWPQTVAEWTVFPGIGAYTSRAICSIAFEQRVLPIDGNVIRVLSRIWKIKDALNTPQDLQKLNVLAEALIKKAPRSLKASVISQALMELGATICKPGDQALCLLCPISKVCGALLSKKVATIPKVKNRPKFDQKIQLAILFQDKNRNILMRQIPPQQRLGGHFEIPLWPLDEITQEHNIIEKISKHFELRGPVKHTITRYRYSTYLVFAEAWGLNKIPPKHLFWRSDGSGSKLLTTTLTRKLLKLLNY
jgi:A/G-specific adenine glycosylase